MLPRLLLDTHIVVRWVLDSKRLSLAQAKTLDMTVQRAEPVALSAITLLEIATLATERKINIRLGLDDFFDELQANPAFRVLPITFEVASEVAALGILKWRKEH